MPVISFAELALRRSSSRAHFARATVSVASHASRKLILYATTTPSREGQAEALESRVRFGEIEALRVNRASMAARRSIVIRAGCCRAGRFARLLLRDLIRLQVHGHARGRARTPGTGRAGAKAVARGKRGEKQEERARRHLPLVAWPCGARRAAEVARAQRRTPGLQSPPSRCLQWRFGRRVPLLAANSASSLERPRAHRLPCARLCSGVGAMSTLDDATLAQLRARSAWLRAAGRNPCAALEYGERFKAAPTRVTASGGVGEPVDALEYAHARCWRGRWPPTPRSRGWAPS